MRCIPIFLIVFLSVCNQIALASIHSLKTFESIPVLDGGRNMPMDTFARLKLLQFSGRSSYSNQTAITWLAKLLFTPETAHGDKIFLVNHPELLEALEVPGEGRRYSFHDLQKGMEKLQKLAQAASEIEEEQRSPLEKEILRVHHNINAYLALFHSFSFASPHEDFTVQHTNVLNKLALDGVAAQQSFLDLYTKIHLLADAIDELSKKESSQWTDEQKEVYRLSSSLYQWGQVYQGMPIAMIPVKGHGEDQWISPWDALAIGFRDEAIKNEIKLLQDLARAYANGQQADFDIAANSFSRSVLNRATPNRTLNHISLELLYNRFDPFYRAEIFYGFAFLVSLIFLLIERKGLRRCSFLLIVLALVPHTWGLVSRMMIMGRPPVTNLFATFIFVAWICVMLGLMVERFQKNGLGLVLSSVSGLILLMISGRFASQGDTLGVVVAVLDSNFWLSTHVVSITIGYAGCCAAGVAGHIYLLQALRCKPDDPKLKSADRAVYGLLAFGLIFSFLGTMLGGVWADQSWGRFWGWDPKENGALLIVIWCSILLHARISKIIGSLGMAVGSVLGVIIVLMAWLGINLLGVGLHSYGFTSGLARGFWITVAVELFFVVATAPFAKKSSNA